MMRTFTSSCCSNSKAAIIIYKHKDVRSSRFKDLSVNRAQPRLFPSDDLARIRFSHLISSQHRRLMPVLSSSSSSPESQVDSENIGTQPEQEIPSKTVNVKFQLQKECSFGEHFYMVGDHPMLGLWDPENAVPMIWSEGHVWTVELDIPVATSIQYKFILKTRTGELLWQPNPDRIFESRETKKTVIVGEDWEEAGYQKVIEEESIADQDGPLLDSETATVAEDSTPPKEELVPGINLTSPEKEQLQALSEELSTVNVEPSLEKPLDTVAENSTPPMEEELVPDVNLTSPEKEQLQALTQELATGSGEPLLEKPLPMVAENISNSTEYFIANAGNGAVGSQGTSYYPNDEALDISNKNVIVAEDLADTDRVDTADVEEILVVNEGNNPVLVPGLSPLPTVSTEEAMSVDEKNSATDASIGVNEASTHTLSELEEKQEPKGEPQEEETTEEKQEPEGEPQEEEMTAVAKQEPEGEPREEETTSVAKQEPDGESQEEETTTVAKDEEEQLGQQIQEPLEAKEEQPDLVEPSPSNVLESDVQWGRKTLQKIIDGLRFL